MTHPYFIAKAREVFSRAGGDPAKAGALAEWAEDAKQIGDPKRGVIVAEDGTIIAATRYQPHAVGYQAGATYVEKADAKRLGLFGDEVGLAVGQLPRLVGQRVIHVTMAEVTRGAGAHVPDLADPLDAARRAAQEAAAADEALRQAVIEAHTAGASPRQIGDAIGVSHTTVHRWIKQV